MTPSQEKLAQHPADGVIAAPSLEVRLCWWIAIYGSGLITVTIHVLRGELSLFGVIFFPLPLGFIFAPLINLLPYSFGKYLVVPCFFMGLVFYAWHLHSTIKAPTRRRFDFLLLLLVLAVLVNVWIVLSMAGGIQA